MTDHDPLCRRLHWEGGDCFACRLLAKVRADERESTAGWEMFVGEVRRDALADLHAKVEALPSMFADDESGGLVILSDVLALIDGGSGE